MSIEIKVPQLPESVTEATLVSWHKQAGDTITRDERQGGAGSTRTCFRSAQGNQG